MKRIQQVSIGLTSVQYHKNNTAETSACTCLTIYFKPILETFYISWNVLYVNHSHKYFLLIDRVQPLK